jgi:hypothetical protein
MISVPLYKHLTLAPYFVRTFHLIVHEPLNNPTTLYTFNLLLPHLLQHCSDPSQPTSFQTKQLLTTCSNNINTCSKPKKSSVFDPFYTQYQQLLQ